VLESVEEVRQSVIKYKNKIFTYKVWL
jgi:uncharacterized protein YlzI (FlbEa/FlbD family)